MRRSRRLKVAIAASTMTASNEAHPGLMIVLPSLDVGGTERQVALLCHGLVELDPAWKPRLTVVVLNSGGEFERLLPDGVSIVSVRSNRMLDLRAALRLRRLVHARRPDAVYSLLAPANLLAAIALVGRPEKLVWGHRTGQVKSRRYGPRRALATLVIRVAARRADAAIANSSASEEFLRSLPGLGGSINIVPNALEPNRYVQDSSVRRDQRSQLGLEDDDLMVLSVGRLVDDKDHETLFAAFKIIRDRLPRALLFLAGPGAPVAIQQRQAWAVQLSIDDAYTYLGAGHDLANLYNAADVVVQSSTNEGSSNVLAEALAVEVPTVSTDCGNAAEMLRADNLSHVGNAPQLAEAALRSLHLPVHRYECTTPTDLAMSTLAVILDTSQERESHGSDRTTTHDINSVV